ncbi:uncharacterized protein LOC143892819 isoform X2 [Tasmannia lanceolata]|uniref:uncharacterized protein LOC143892819 isoform X2 n=1 Tax=Tasmannia lanceolata TaxID=3420 RepID=UPI004063B570
MVFEANRGTTNPALIFFVPRQVLLEKQSMKNKSSYETLENGSTDKTLESKQKKKKSIGSRQMTVLLHSIAAYLDSIGFSKTLTALRSESPLEIDDWKAYSLDLEDMYHKYLETSECPTEANMKGSKEQDSQKYTGKKDEGESKCDASEDLVCKKKRKKSSDSDAGMETEGISPGVGNGSAINAVIDDLHMKSKEKKKNKNKLVSDSLGDSIELVQLEIFKEMAEKVGDESQLGDLHAKSKDKKKNKNKLSSDSCDENAKQVGSETLQDVVRKKNKNLKPLGDENKIDYQLPDSVTENISDKVPSDEANTKIKDKKKKHKSKDCESTGDLNQTDFKKEEVLVSEVVSVVAVEKKSSKKRKRLASEEKESGVDDKIAIKESNHSTTEISEENKEMEILPKESTILAGNGYLNPGKKRKSETSEVGTVKAHNTSLPFEDLTEVDAHANGILVKNGKGGGFTPKTTKKEHKGSDEPKTINAFQRVKVEEVEFVDERLQDNSYWAKGGADSGYGAKAQEVLGQVRGRDFRHEKTKKKRGSYRGGQIDLQSHSIKFNYSDDE